jgi:hypothetical protein
MVKDLYLHLRYEGNFPYKFLWEVKIPLKVNFSFTWLLQKNINIAFQPMTIFLKQTGLEMHNVVLARLGLSIISCLVVSRQSCFAGGLLLGWLDHCECQEPGWKLD